MTNVLHIISSLRRGGRERQLAIISKNGINTQNYLYVFEQSDSSYADEYQIKDQIVYAKTSGYRSRISEIVKLVKQLDIRAIVAWGNVEALHAIPASLLSSTRFLNFSIRHGIRKFKRSHLFRTFILHISPVVVANSHAGLRANNLRRGYVLYNGIENIPDQYSKDSLITLYTKLNVSRDRLLLISVANMVPYKDYGTVLSALARVKQTYPTFCYIILGDGPMRKSIIAKINDLGLTDNVILAGNVSNVDEYLSISDIMIHSSMGEGCSNAILEAMKHSLPIIASKVGGTPEIVKASFGFLFNYQDVEDLYAKLMILIEDKNLRLKMGESARKEILESYSVPAMIRKYEVIIDTVL